MGLGTLDAPFETITRAMAIGSLPESPVIVNVASGTYNESVTMTPWKTIEGPDPMNPAAVIISSSSGAVVTGASGCGIQNVCLVTQDYSGTPVLFDGRDTEPALVAYCEFRGNYNANATGLLLVNTGEGMPLVHHCRFRSIGTAIKALNTKAKIAFCRFEDIDFYALVRPGSIEKANDPWLRDAFTFKDGEEDLPVMGLVGDTDSG